MTVVSSKEFASNQDKYFDLAFSNEHIHEDIIFQPDDDFYRSITMEEVRDKLHKVLDKLYADR